MDTTQLYNIWLKNVKEPELISELKAIKDFPEEISDRFYKDLEFGTAGLRSTIGAGTNRMNVYTVSRTTQGVAQYLKENFSNPNVAIAYDSRIKSDEFARAAADVLAANGIKVYIYSELMPTPMLSYAVKNNRSLASVNIRKALSFSGVTVIPCLNPDGREIFAESGNCIYLPKESRYRLFFSHIKENPSTYLINCHFSFGEKEHVLAKEPVILPHEKKHEIREIFGKIADRKATDAHLFQKD